ncbi:MAG: response regulator, partial [Gammaproteobacteria bacterium]
MAINVLIVDDSTFICKRVREILEQPLPTGKQPFKVVGEAHNGLEAVRLAQALEPDVITMDIEMPLLDGISAVKRIMQTAPTPILMFSAMTQVGAQATLDALEAGAVDFLPKRLDDIDADRETAKKLLRRRVGTVALEAGRIKNRPRPAPAAAGEVKTARHVVATAAAPAVRPRLIVIAASTG